MAQEVQVQTFSNGLTLLAERMDHVRSAAVNILVPAGAIYDRIGREGIGTLLAELIIRGAGERDSRRSPSPSTISAWIAVKAWEACTCGFPGDFGDELAASARTVCRHRAAAAFSRRRIRGCASCSPCKI